MLHPIDIITKDGHATGRLSDPEEANNKGLWHRGVHVILYTRSGSVLVQKRSLEIIGRPGMLDIGVGGYVDSGETSEQAAIREVKEEANITISLDQLRPIGITRYNHRWKYGKRQKISRMFIYSFACQLEDKQLNDVTPQREEVAWIGFLSLSKAKRLVHFHRLKRLGVLSPTYAYYRKLLQAVDPTV